MFVNVHAKSFANPSEEQGLQLHKFNAHSKPTSMASPRDTSTSPLSYKTANPLPPSPSNLHDSPATQGLSPQPIHLCPYDSHSGQSPSAQTHGAASPTNEKRALYMPRSPTCGRDQILCKSKQARGSHLHLLQCTLLQIPNACSYNIVIKAYCNGNDVGSAFGLFRHMEAQGCLSDVITYGALIGGLCHNGRVQESIGLLHQMHEKSCDPDVVVYNTIINRLCREGDLGRVNEMLSDMEVRGCKPDVVTYNSFMYGLCKMGKFQDAVDLLKDVMPQKGIHPDVVSFSTVMCFAKPHEFRVLQGSMLAKGFNLDVAGCSIIIKALCKEGSNFEAVHVVHSFPSAVSYRVIIGSLCDKGMYKHAREILGEALKKGFGKNHEKKFRRFQSL